MALFVGATRESPGQERESGVRWSIPCMGPICQAKQTVSSNRRWMEWYTDKRKFARWYTGIFELFNGMYVNFCNGIGVKDSSFLEFELRMCLDEK